MTGERPQQQDQRKITKHRCEIPVARVLWTHMEAASAS